MNDDVVQSLADRADAALVSPDSHEHSSQDDLTENSDLALGSEPSEFLDAAPMPDSEMVAETDEPAGDGQQLDADRQLHATEHPDPWLIADAGVERAHTPGSDEETP